MLRDINFFQIILENFDRKIFPITLIYYVSIVRQNFYGIRKKVICIIRNIELLLDSRYHTIIRDKK